MNQIPPRAFTQGVGSVFQFTGVSLFLIMMFICCGSALVSKDKAESKDYTQIGWHLAGDPLDQPTISEQKMIAIAVPAGVFLGLGLATLGLGLQAENRFAPIGAVLLTGVGLTLWIVDALFAASVSGSITLILLSGILTLIFAALFALAVVAWLEMHRHPPATGHELLPADYIIPYSHLHQDPPEVRLARELNQRRQKLEIEQKELEQLERRLKHYTSDKPQTPDKPRDE
jgi:hypothetical protein